MANKLKLCVIGGPDVDLRVPLLERLARSFDVSVMGSDSERGEKVTAAGFGFECYPLARDFSLWRDWQSVRALRPGIRRLQPDIVHCFDTKPAVVGRLAARMEGVPVVLGTLPGLGGLFTYDSWQVRWRRSVYQQLHRLAACLSEVTVFQNPDDRDDFCQREVVAPHQTHLILGSGACARRFNARAVTAVRRRQLRDSFGLSDTAPVVVFVGRLIRSKGVMDAVGAAEALRQRHPGLQLVVAGGLDVEAADCLTAAELASLRRNAVWLGECSAVPELLACADVLMFPSYYREGIPRVLVEAAMLELPTVCADNVGSREVVVDEETGLLIPPRDIEALARAVDHLLVHRDFALRLGREARVRALQHFEVSIIADHHERLYHDLWGKIA